MGRFERRLRKKVSQCKKPYSVWREEHKDELSKVTDMGNSEENYGAVKAKRRGLYTVFACIAGLLLLIAAVLIGLNATNQSAQPGLPDLTFGEDLVNVSYMTEEETAEIIEQVPQFSNFLVTLCTKSTHVQDGSLVMYTIRGELETADDFYLIEARILYNDNFAFLGRTYYTNFEETQIFGDTEVSYKFMGQHSDDIYQYLLLSENSDITVYWDIDSYEGLFDEWLSIIFE